jgi:predicted nucleic acid-binding protein
MPDSQVFLDTNILVYAYSVTDPDKSECARRLLASSNVVISAQVVNEFVAVGIRKLGLTPEKAEAVLSEIRPFVEVVPLTFDIAGKALKLMQEYAFFGMTA